MTNEDLTGISGLAGACTSDEALEAAGSVIQAVEPGLAAWRIGTEEGCDSSGRSVRWEIRYDLSRRRREAVLSVAFTFDEATGAYGSGVVAVRFLPFPAEGSELAKMARAGEITERRLTAIWRQQRREREPLPAGFPDSSRVAEVVAPELIRSAYARITRMRGAVWVVETAGRTRHLRLDDLR